MSNSSIHPPCDPDRRRWITAAGATVAVLTMAPLSGRAAAPEGDPGKIEVTAAEDLMREHGVLRRALLVYAEAASRLDRADAKVNPDALLKTAQLFRRFGEDYHERSLEEAHVFPVIIKAGGNHATLAQTLIAQHARGRDITDYIVSVTRGGNISKPNAAPMATSMRDLVRMYQHHAAVEDTIIFPAWKAALSADQYEDLNEQFEELEHKLFGKDGFDDAIKQVASAEEAFGLADLSTLTAAAPPIANGKR